MQWRLILKHYWPFIRRYPRSHVVMFAAYGLGQFSLVALSPYVFKLIIDALSEPGPDTVATITTLFWVFVSLVVFHNIIFRIGDYAITYSQSQILKELTDYSLEKLLKHSHTFYSNAFSGSIIAKTNRFVNAFETLHDTVVFQFWFHTITFIGALGVLFYESVVLGCILLVWFAGYVLLVRVLISYQVPKSLAEAAAESKTTGHLSDIITNVLTVKMFGAPLREQKSFAVTTETEERARYNAWMQDGFWNAMWQGLAIAVFNVSLVWYALELWKADVITVGTIVLVQFYMIRLFDVIWNLSKNAIKFSTALADASEMVEIFEQEIEVKDPAKPEVVAMPHGAVSFKDVDFSYDNQNQVFDKLSLDIASGEKVALVGHSGAGKTTVTKLLLRFLDIKGGLITIDGQDVTAVTQDDLRRQIAYVPQEPLLFHRTLQENIAYVNPDATLEDVMAVAKKAHAHEFISKLPNGYDTLVGERGVKLSGGERQRVAIARAMLKEAPIVLLDEATSALDSVSEQKIQDALWQLVEGKTTIVIAHRLSTIQKMDRILVFDDGKIVEEGTHQELLDRRGEYARLWDSQVGGFITDTPSE